ncbi:MAG: hypothetical protein ACOC35_13985, partial [Promethearchaeia archaeon]
CPQCQTEKKINLPTQLVKESSHLVTVSIPRNFMCTHGFQAFIDKNFNIRGYHKADFGIDEMEIYETGKKELNLIINYKLSLIIKNLIENLERAIRDSEVQGGALITQNRKVLYLSLPDEIFLDVKKQLEFQRDRLKRNIKKVIFVLEGGSKLFIDTINIENITLFICVSFASNIEIVQANDRLKKIINYFHKL